MRVLDNISSTLKDDLSSVLKKDSKVMIAASCFSMYAFQELKKELSEISELKFIFTSPSFSTEKAAKEKREFYIPRLTRERSLFGTEFEVKLRNELTQKSIAKECADWIRKKATFKTNVTQANMSGFMNVHNSDEKYTYMPLNGFTSVDLGCEKGNLIYTMMSRFEAPHSDEFYRTFNEVWHDKEKLQDVTEEVISNITSVYKENPPEFIYYITLFNIFSEFLEDICEDVLPNDATGFRNSLIWKKLYPFQKDAAFAIINKLEKYNGCILADSVGLGKTFTALAVIKYYENRNKSVLVLCPKKLSDNWNTYKQNLLNNPVYADRLRYDVLYHTDLSRDNGTSNGIKLDLINWGNYDLVVIDESHNFRNGGKMDENDDDDQTENVNRYQRLLNRVIRQGVKTKVLMLSATPVNNRFLDLKNQLALAYEGDDDLLNDKLKLKNSIDTIFRQAQRAFTLWSQYDAAERTTERLLAMLDFDFFELLDSVTIARSRKHIQRYYDTSDIGPFPTRNKPISKHCGLSDLPNIIQFNQIFCKLSSMNLGVYNPSKYIHPSKREKYSMYNSDMGNTIFNQSDREEGIVRLMRINLLKRLESSVHAFRLTLTRMLSLIDSTIENIDGFQSVKVSDIDDEDLDIDDMNVDEYIVGQKVKIDLSDMDYVSWLADIKLDREIIETLLEAVRDITPEHDLKLKELWSIIENKFANPINNGNKKVLIFSAFTDTVHYLYENISPKLYAKYHLHSAMITGGDDSCTTHKGISRDFHSILTCFSPISKERSVILPNVKDDIEVLFATDCISEGQNLQDCDYLINYDIHWNPVRIIQRFGRIDRIGSKNSVIQLVNFWPDLSLDEYINLKSRVETRMKISVMTATGDDNPIENDRGDLEYRKHQLERLQKEVVDIEEMSSGVSIMDLGLNEFRMDLVEYYRAHDGLDSTPYGLHAVVSSGEDVPPGVIYVLKNINKGINPKNQNRLHPFYMVYMTDDGRVISNHLDPKKTLDIMRLACRGKTEPIAELCRSFNESTNDGRKMTKYSDLLHETISSIIHVKEESDIDSLFSPGGTTALRDTISGLNDFELICFLVVR
jgi:hypothetical protein